MNDPGLDQPIDQADSQVHHVYEKENNNVRDTTEEEEEMSHLLPARWWYASTAIPLLAGTFGPMANAFSICALVENWRVEIPPGGTEQHGIDLRDPRWLIAVNAVSLVCALTANISLLLNMARRVSFSVAQPITILGFWTASILLIALITVTSTNINPSSAQNQALTQAYYYAIFAAGLYQIISYLMCITVWGAYKGHYSKEFKLTAAQRTLMLQTISFLVYQHLWALGYSHIEGWKFLDAVYWADFTSLTIGIGADYVPKTHLGRSLLFPFALGGIVILGLVIGSIRSLVLDRGKKKLAARMTEKTRRRLVKQIETSMQKDQFHPRNRIGIDKDMCRALTLKPGDDKMQEKDRRQYEFDAMRKVQERAKKNKQYLSLMISTVAFAFLWMMGAYVFWKAEKNQKWTYFECLYFAYTSLLTIGYGDLQPISNSGKPFFVFWSLLAIPTLTILISNMGDTVVKGVKDATIWLGEVTVLPSDDASVVNRLKYGIKRITLGLLDPEKTPELAAKRQLNSDSNDFRELHPGIAKVFRWRRERQRTKQRQETGERLATDFEQEEKMGEEEAKDRGDEVAEDEHHYRRQLLSQVRRVYADATASVTKKYSYDEWAFFLELLGEDESDSRYHLRAPSNQKKHKKQHAMSRTEIDENAHNRQSDIIPPNRSGGPDADDVVKWSWIGTQSPLMGDKEESEWLLEKLFQRLEESMREQLQARDSEGHESNQQQDSQRNEPSDQETTRQNSKVDDSSPGEAETNPPSKREIQGK